MGEVRDIISRKIRELRTEHDMTQIDLAKVLKVKNTAVSNWENGSNAPDIETLMKICNFFHIGISEMYGNTELANSISLSATEHNMLAQFRALPDSEKEAVLEYLEMKYIKATSAATEKEMA